MVLDLREIAGNHWVAGLMVHESNEALRRAYKEQVGGSYLPNHVQEAFERVRLKIWKRYDDELQILSNAKYFGSKKA